MSAADLTPATRTSEDVRVANTALVLRALRADGPSSRAVLAASTGLTKGTVGTIVGRLSELGAVCEPAVEQAPAGRGRPSRPVSLDGTPLVGLGVEVNVDYRAAVALDLAGDTRLFVEERGAPGDDRVDVAEVGAFVRRCRRRLEDEGHRLLGLCLAVPGLVERDRRVVRSAPNLGWHDLDLAAAVAGGVPAGTPVRVDNDANCAARAEASVGVASGADHVLYVTGTVGVGGGVVTDGAVLQGLRGFAGEIGHMRVGDSDAVCACGRRGCWEALVGLRAMLRRVGLPDEPDADPREVAETVAARAAVDAGVRAGLASLADDLASGCAILANALDPGTIVLGGYFATLAPWLLPVVRARLERDVFAGGCTVEPSTLGLRAAATGAAAHVLADVFEARVPLPTP
ncbi:ROK family protein [Solicola sp. PLA-1-18]|uniref:ROK family protein n=1 Tax=Solicola sp. PLA-1-18 TaxID=3380532 RepID=UPI003B78FE59